MRNMVIVGAQWGDEGKGKFIDLLTGTFDVVVRCQGGHNAGHTVILGAEKFVLHLIPSGILRPGKLCVIGDGLVVDPTALLIEIEMLRERGVVMDGRLFLSSRAHLILPLHQAMDRRLEEIRGGAAIGTTLRGIGPAYADKAYRIGLRVGDTLDADRFRERVDAVIGHYRALYGEEFAASVPPEQWDRFLSACSRIREFVADTSLRVARWAAEGKRILMEGAQGVMLDLDHGTYPFVTSSSAAAGGSVTGSGLPPQAMGAILGVMKAYTTRVGGGPFPTELNDEYGETLRRVGGEYGASTGRPRRCGWLDLVQMRYACRVNGFHSLLLTKLDVLDGFDQIRVATGYQLDGRDLEDVPSAAEDWALVEPRYVTLPGWSGRTAGVRDPGQLPENARAYIRFIEKELGVEVGMVSTGADRDETILLPEAKILRGCLGEKAEG